MRLAELADEFDAEQVAADARSVAERVSEERFYVACIGQFKRGKSSVLNALVGDSVLPTGLVPRAEKWHVAQTTIHGRVRARKIMQEGAPAVQAALDRLNRRERDVSALR
jgi:Dynamin family